MLRVKMTNEKCSVCGKKSAFVSMIMSLTVIHPAKISEKKLKVAMGEYYVKGAKHYSATICYECFFKAIGVRKPFMTIK